MSSPAATRRGVHEGLARATSAGRRACCSNYVSRLPCPPNTRSELLIGRSTRYSAMCGAHTQEATNFENTLLLSTSFRCEKSRFCRIFMRQKPYRTGGSIMIVDRYDPMNLFEELVPKLK